jgi:hypothetical protein
MPGRSAVLPYTSSQLPDAEPLPGDPLHLSQTNGSRILVMVVIRRQKPVTPIGVHSMILEKTYLRASHRRLGDHSTFTGADDLIAKEAE